MLDRNISLFNKNEYSCGVNVACNIQVGTKWGKGHGVTPINYREKVLASFKFYCLESECDNASCIGCQINRTPEMCNSSTCTGLCLCVCVRVREVLAYILFNACKYCY